MMSGTSSWRKLDSADAVAAALIDFYERRGDDRYDEDVTQNEHALQCGALALEAGATTATVTAAFLHDIGHLLMHDPTRDEGLDDDRRDDDMDRDDVYHKDRHHELVGARFLANWFGAAVTEPIRLHVPAKRYLCATSPGYHGELSSGSVASLVVQGGPMSPPEIAEFEAGPLAMAAVDLRRWDDLAKVPMAATPSFDVFADLMIGLIELSELSER